MADLKEADSDDDNEMRDAEQAIPGSSSESAAARSEGKVSLKEKIKDGALFREVVLAKLKDERQKKEALEVDQELEKEARRRSFNS